jgi:hypothetical protein
MRRKVGWPPASPPAPPSNSDEEPSELAEDLEMLMSDEGSAAVPGHQGKMYENWGENRDVDIKWFHHGMK